MAATVRDALPSTAMVTILNPALRVLLRTPLGRAIKQFALLEFTGRKSGKQYRFPVGWYESDGRGLIFTPAPWRANFRPSSPATVHYRGRVKTLTGTLVTDPGVVAGSLDAVLRSGVAPRLLGMEVPQGHRITVDDVRLLNRALIEFRAG